VTAPEPTGDTVAEEAAPGDDPGERGTTEIRSAAVERLVAAAVGEVADTAEVRRLWGRAPAEVRARVAGGRVTGTVRVAVRYPTPIPAVAARIRERVARQVGELCGLDMGPLDVDVVGLVGEAVRPRVE
jgi:uncharacterized alkaline shock family protein YloU